MFSVREALQMITIRAAVAADVAAISAIVTEAYSPYIARIGKPPGPMRDDYAALVADGVVDVADDRRGIAGLVVTLLAHSPALLDNVAVAARARGMGLGRRLIEHAEARAKAAGHHVITLYTNVMMTENLALYPRLGYRETGRRHENGFDRVYFAKDLT
jgi:ribosomal protein S18 acetylase RimI-like enzyme